MTDAGRRSFGPAGMVLMLLVGCAGMGLPNLGQRLFWQDEAETAVIARNIRRYGLPRVYDGRNLVTTDGGKDFNADYLLTSKPWLPYYIVAGAQSLLGETQWSGRLPFVLCVTAAVVWLGLALRRVASPGLALFTSVYTVSGVPLWLMARQARYYGLAILLTVAAMALYLKWREQRENGRPAAWVIPLILLAHTHYQSVLYVAVGIGLHLLLTCGYRGRWRSLGLTVLCGLLGVLPWLFYSGAGAWFHTPAAEAPPDLETVFPLVVNVAQPLLLPLGALVWLATLLSWPHWRARWAQPWVQLSLLMVGSTLLLHVAIGYFRLAPPWTRYLVTLFPCYAVVFGAAASALVARRPILGLAAAAAVQLTTAPTALLWRLLPMADSYYLPRLHQLHRPQAQFYAELTRPYRGPLDCIVGELRAHARPDDTVFIEFETEPVVWYTGLTVLRSLPFETPPDWIILRPSRGSALMGLLQHGIGSAAVPIQRSAWWKVRPELLGAFMQDNHRYVLDYLRRHPYQKVVTSCPEAPIYNSRSW